MNAPGLLSREGRKLALRALSCGNKAGQKVYPRFQAAQPVEKLLFERANPRISNTIERLMSRVFGANGHEPRKPKRIDRTDAAAH